jgi:WD40 repeat protein
VSQEEDGRKPSGANDGAARLDSWKAIAFYLKRDVRTVQRWEKDERLPVYRHPHKKLGSVYAYQAELDAWWNDGRSRLEELPEEVPPDAEGEPSNGHATPEAAHAAGQALPRRPRIALLAILALLMLTAVLVSLMTRSSNEAYSPKISSVHVISHDTFWKNSLATDGIRAYYTERSPGHAVLASASLGETWSEPSVIPLALAHPKILGIAPGGSQLLLVDSRSEEAKPLIVLSLSDDRLREFPGVAASCAAWSPDNQWLAFCEGDGVFRVQEGMPPEKLAAFHGTPDSLVWYPDGGSLRVIVAEPHGATSDPSLSLWRVEVPGGKAISVALPEAVRHDCGATIAETGDARYLALASRCTESSALWLLPDGPGLFGRHAGWMQLDADFGRITQVASAPGSDKLLVLDAQSGPVELMRYTPHTETWTPVSLGTNPVELDYSRDGHWVTYVEYPQRTLWRARADGRERRQLTFPPLRAQLPHWSPDGRSIAFTGVTPGTSWKVYLVGANGGEARAAFPGGGDQGAPTWSPDGHALVFGDIEINGSGAHFIHYLDLRTRKMENLPGSAGLRTARWAPDGRHVAAILFPKRKLELFDLRTRKWTAVADGVSGDTLNWSADGRLVYFDSRYEPHPGILRYDVAARRIETVMDFGSLRAGPDLTTDVSGFSVAPDGSLLMDVSMQSSRVYAVHVER